MGTMEQFYQWNENDTTIGEPHTSYKENSWDKNPENQFYQEVTHALEISASSS